MRLRNPRLLAAGACLAVLLGGTPWLALTAPVALVGGTVWTGEGPSIPNGVVLLEGDRITAVGPAATTPLPPEVEVVSTEGMTVLPGLIDLAVQTWRLGHGNPTQADPLLRPLAARVIAPWVLNNTVAAGVTRVLELDSPTATALELRTRVAGRRLPGPQLGVAGAVLPWEAGNGAMAKAQQALADGVDVLVLDAPEEWPPAELQLVVGLAHAAGRPVWVRLRWGAGLVPALEAGADALIGLGLDTAPTWSEAALAAVRARAAAGKPVGWLPQLAPLSTRVRWERDAEALDSPEIFRGLPPLLAQDLRASWTPYVAVAAPSEAALRAAAAGPRVRALREAGAVLLAGSGAGAPGLPHALALREELFALVRVGGLSPAEALRTATVDAAVALGGSAVLAPGARADVIAVRGPVLEDIGALRDIAVVFAAGRRMK